MELFRHEVPGIERKDDAIEYINEFLECGSEINGVGSLDRYIEDYEGWLQKLEIDRTMEPNEQKVPADTYFLVRENDNRIVGMINIRHCLNENLKQVGGHIGYSIRPSERRKGYNKVNLYLGLIRCQELGIKEVLMDCDKDNLGSAKTMLALGGVMVKEYFDDEIAKCLVQDYVFDVDKCIELNKSIYEPLVNSAKVK